MIDVDVHHGDGVQEAFYMSDKVREWSLLERDATLILCRVIGSYLFVYPDVVVRFPCDCAFAFGVFLFPSFCQLVMRVNLSLIRTSHDRSAVLALLLSFLPLVHF